MSTQEGSTFWSDAVKQIPFIGPVLGGALDRGASRRAIERQNEYNKPINQLARLREAGLPFAAMTNAISGNQSQPAETASSGLERLSDYSSTRVSQIQLDLIKAQIDATKAMEQKTLQEAQGQAQDNQLQVLDPKAGEPISFGARQQSEQLKGQELDNWIKENHGRISQIEAEVKEDLHRTGTLSAKVRAELQNLFMGNRLMMQQYRTIHAATAAADRLIKQLEEGKGGMTVAEAFYHQLLGGGMKNFVPMQFNKD